jgi:hypothetical protein
VHAFPVSVKGVAVRGGKVLLHGCHVLSSDPPVVSHEHKQAGLFAPGAVLGLVMPEGYKRSIADWFARLGSGPGSR